MKKFFTFVAVVLFALPIFADDIVVVLDSIDFKDPTIVTKQGAASPGSEVLAVKDGVTISIDKGQNKGFCLTAFAHSNVTISAEQNIKQLNFEFGKVSGTAKDGGLDPQIAVGANEWSASDLASQARFAKITITLGVCYIASIKTPYDATYGNVTVWLNDDITSTYGNIQAYRAKCSAEDGAALAEHDRVLVVGNLTHTQNEEGTKDYYEIAQGAQLTRLSGQGIENILLQENVQKVIVDGVVYVVREGKMFNLQGVQVR